MKKLFVLVLFAILSITQFADAQTGSTLSNASTTSTSSTSSRLSLDINNYTIDGAAGADKINDAKQGKFQNVGINATGDGGGGGGGLESGTYFKDTGYEDPQCCDCMSCYPVCPVRSNDLPFMRWADVCGGG